MHGSIPQQTPLARVHLASPSTEIKRSKNQKAKSQNKKPSQASGPAAGASDHVDMIEHIGGVRKHSSLKKETNITAFYL